MTSYIMTGAFSNWFQSYFCVSGSFSEGGYGFSQRPVGGTASKIRVNFKRAISFFMYEACKTDYVRLKDKRRRLIQHFLILQTWSRKQSITKNVTVIDED